MEPKSLFSLNPSLEEVRKQFENWRLSREKRAPIPNALWQAAISLHPHHSVYEISKALRLNYTDLKHRVEAQRSVIEPVGAGAPSFIELDVSAATSSAQCMVEMQHRDGAKMKMYFNGDVRADLLELAISFWNKDA